MSFEVSTPILTELPPDRSQQYRHRFPKKMGDSRWSELCDTSCSTAPYNAIQHMVACQNYSATIQPLPINDYHQYHQQQHSFYHPHQYQQQHQQSQQQLYDHQQQHFLHHTLDACCTTANDVATFTSTMESTFSGVSTPIRSAPYPSPTFSSSSSIDSMVNFNVNDSTTNSTDFSLIDKCTLPMDGMKRNCDSMGKLFPTLTKNRCCDERHSSLSSPLRLTINERSVTSGGYEIATCTTASTSELETATNSSTSPSTATDAPSPSPSATTVASSVFNCDDEELIRLSVRELNQRLLVI